MMDAERAKRQSQRLRRSAYVATDSWHARLVHLENTAVRDREAADRHDSHSAVGLLGSKPGLLGSKPGLLGRSKESKKLFHEV